MTPLKREASENDHNFILATWLNSYYSGMKDYRPSKTTYFKSHQALALLKLKHAIVICNNEDHDQIIGYAIIEGDVLHYIYIKNVFRGFGFGKMLLEGKTINHVSHITSDIKKLIKKPNYNPYLFK